MFCFWAIIWCYYKDFGTIWHLAKALTQVGHEVTVVCSSRGYDDPRVRFPKREIWNAVDIIRIRSTGFGKSSKWRRAADFGTFMASCVFRLWSLPQFDVVVAMTSPPLISFVAALAVPGRARSLVCCASAVPHVAAQLATS